MILDWNGEGEFRLISETQADIERMTAAIGLKGHTVLDGEAAILYFSDKSPMLSSAPRESLNVRKVE